MPCNNNSNNNNNDNNDKKKFLVKLRIEWNKGCNWGISSFCKLKIIGNYEGIIWD
jgi:hypothetical protein